MFWETILKKALCLIKFGEHKKNKIKLYSPQIINTNDVSKKILKLLRIPKYSNCLI